MTAASKERVVVIYGTAASVAEDRVNVITFGNGNPRVYDRDSVESRARPESGDMPYFDDIENAKLFISENPNVNVQLSERAARHCGLFS